MLGVSGATEATTIVLVRQIAPFLLIAGHFALCLLAWRLGFQQRRPVAAGDAQTAFGGGFLLYWSVIFALAWRYQEHNWLFRFLNARGHAFIVAVGFGLIGTALLLLGVGLFGA